MTLKQTKQKGFTIVELLIVVVIIAILAAITIVAYNGIQNRANTSAAQSQAASIVKKFEALNAIKGAYYSTNGAGVTGAQINTYAAATPVSSEGNIDTPTAVIAATGAAASNLTAATAKSGNMAVVSAWACTAGANVWYWDYTQATPAATLMKAGAGC